MKAEGDSGMKKKLLNLTVLCLLLPAVHSLAQAPAKTSTWKDPEPTAQPQTEGTKKAAPAKAQAPAAATPPQVPQTIESQPSVPPGTQPGQDQFEQSPAELQQMACEINKLIKATEAKATPNDSPELIKSRDAIINSRKKELRGVLSIHKKVTGQNFNLETCQ